MKNLCMLLAVMLIGLNSCKDKSTEPEEQEVVEVKAERVDVQCFQRSPSKNFVVNSEAEYQQIMTEYYGGYCDIDLDFSKYTLLITEFYASSRCPIPPVYATITKNNRSKLYTFLFEYGFGGNCAWGWQETFWYKIPKIDTTYAVEFESRDLNDQKKLDSIGMNTNLKLWASNTSYGTAKTVFKKGESLFINYSFKNYTGKPLDWFQSDPGEFCDMYMRNITNEYRFPKERISIGTLIWGTLKKDEVVATSWEINDPAIGEYYIISSPVRDFKPFWFPQQNIKIVIEE